MPDRRSEGGFTLIELLVGMALFSLASVGFYQVLFAGSTGAKTSQAAARVSEEARLGLNRLVRDTREAADLKDATANSYRIEINFDGNPSPDPVPSDPAGDYELLIVEWNPVSRTVTLSNGVTTEVLMRDVDCIRKADNSCQDVFRYTSSRLEYDTNGDGVSSGLPELDQAPSLGNNNGVLDGQEPRFIDAVKFSFRVEKVGRSTNFYAEAQMRNFR